MTLVRASLRLLRVAQAPHTRSVSRLSTPVTARLHSSVFARNVSSTAGRRTTLTASAASAPAEAQTITPGSSTGPGSGSGSGSSGSGGSSRLRFGVGLALVPLALVAGGAYVLRPSEPALGVSNISTVPTSALLRAYLVYTICSSPMVIDAAPGLLHAFTHSPIPGLKALTEFVVRYTFFDQFVAGENLPECVSAMHGLYNRGMGGVLNYSAEAELGDGLAGVHRAAEAHNFQECTNAIEALGEFERQIVAGGGVAGSSSFAIKISGLIDPTILERASTTICRLRPLAGAAYTPYADAPFPGVPQMSDEMIVAPQVGNTASLPSVTGAIEPLGILASDAGVTDADMASLHEFWGRLHTLSARARDLGVKLMIDAEHCSTQPILDAMTLVLSREFNRPQPGVAAPFSGPIIFGTYQSYLRRAPQLLEAAIRDSETHGYALGIKIVRGAYFVSEREEWRAAGRAGADPIWPNKPATDSCYDTCIDTITTTLAAQISGPHPETALSVVFATHNPESVQLVLDQLEKTGLAERPLELAPDGAINPSPRLRLRDSLRSKVFLAQLYGMRDDLTDTVVDSFEPGAPVALKYIAYGKLDEVLPFLARRAIENKSIMTGEGGAAVERKRVTDELKRRWSR